jgi:hypothetical protein
MVDRAGLRSANQGRPVNADYCPPYELLSYVSIPDRVESASEQDGLNPLSRKYHFNLRADFAEGRDGHTFSMGVAKPRQRQRKNSGRIY